MEPTLLSPRMMVSVGKALCLLHLTSQPLKLCIPTLRCIILTASLWMLSLPLHCCQIMLPTIGYQVQADSAGIRALHQQQTHSQQSS